MVGLIEHLFNTTPFCPVIVTPPLLQATSAARAEFTNPRAAATKLILKVRLKILLFFILIPLDYKKSQLIE